MSRVIELTVSPKGETSVQTKGFTGGTCIQASKWIEQALGIVTADQKTGEFYAAAQNEQHVEQK